MNSALSYCIVGHVAIVKVMGASADYDVNVGWASVGTLPFKPPVDIYAVANASDSSGGDPWAGTVGQLLVSAETGQVWVTSTSNESLYFRGTIVVPVP